MPCKDFLVVLFLTKVRSRKYRHNPISGAVLSLDLGKRILCPGPYNLEDFILALFQVYPFHKVGMFRVQGTGPPRVPVP